MTKPKKKKLIKKKPPISYWNIKEKLKWNGRKSDL